MEGGWAEELSELPAPPATEVVGFEAVLGFAHHELGTRGIYLVVRAIPFVSYKQ